MFSSEVVQDILAHHGVKGMRWGVRRSRSSSVTVSEKERRSRLREDMDVQHMPTPFVFVRLGK